MTAETHALRKRRKFLLEQLSRAADELGRIDARLKHSGRQRNPDQERYEQKRQKSKHDR